MTLSKRDEQLQQIVSHQFVGIHGLSVLKQVDGVTLELRPNQWLDVAQQLRDSDALRFEQLIDVCGVDYLSYGQSEWETTAATGSGYSRGTEMSNISPENNAASDPINQKYPGIQTRFAAVYQLLSLTHNRRLRVRVWLDPRLMSIPSVVDVWKSADWFEREAFDLYGIIFEGHPDLRRLLTDYGFKGHPFRKDFPLIGENELRYDATEQRCIYEPVSIQPRVLVPRVVREDHRYCEE